MGIPPVVAAITLLFALSLTSASAADPPATESRMSPASVASASYSGSVNDRVASVDVDVAIFPVRSGRCAPLFGDDVAVQEFTAKNGQRRTVPRRQHRRAVRLEGRRDVQIKMLVKLGGDVTKRWFTLPPSPALSSRMSFVIDQPDADVDFQNAVSFKRTTSGQQTRMEAVIGAADWITVQWTPRVKRAAEVAATIFCQKTRS